MNKTPITNLNNEKIQCLQSPKIGKEQEPGISMRSDLQIKTFSPKENILYCYFIERNKTIKDQSDTINQHIYGIDNVIDIQRFCYYPGSKDIFTFLGFSSQLKLKAAINHLISSELIIDNKIELFSKNSIVQLEENQHWLNLNGNNHCSRSDRRKKKELNNQQKNTDSNKKALTIENKTKENVSNIKKINLLCLPKCADYDTSNLTITEFEPIEKVYYIFFAEKSNPTIESINPKDKLIYKLYGVYALIIQRYRYYPETDKIYTFLGFSNQNLAVSAMNNARLKSEAVDNTIYSYPFECDDILKQEQIDGNYKTFFPKKNLHYCYFIPKDKSNKLNLFQYSIDSISDMQCFCYFPGTKFIYTFLGFSSEKLLKKVISQQSLQLASLNHEINIFSQNKNEIEKNENDKNKNENDLQIELSILLFIDDFIPDENLFYCFFDEKTKPNECITSSHYKNVEYYKFNINDIQRFHYLKEKHSAFSFFGFQSECELFQFITDQTINSLATNETIYIYSKNRIINFKKDILKDDQVIDIHNSKVIDNETFREFKPKNYFYYIYFIEKKNPNTRRLNERINSIKLIKNASDVQRYSYYPNTNNIYSFFGFSKVKSLLQSIENLTKNDFSIDDINIYYENLNQIPDEFNSFYINKLKFFLKQKDTNKSKNKIVHNEFLYKEFTPKENIFYVYLEESEKFQIKDKVKKVFDIQRNCYYPGSHDVYSFFGFKNKKYVDMMISDYSLKLRLSKNQFYIYFKASINIKETKLQTIKEFKYKENLIYIYLKENEEEMILSENRKDIQRFCYYPRTKDIYSFYGFSNKNDIIDSIQNSNLKINDIICIKIYSKSSDINTNIIAISENYEEKIMPHLKFCKNIKEGNDSKELKVERINEEKTEKKSINNTQSLNLSLLLFIDDFIPDANLFYCFFNEKTKPKKCITSLHYKNVKYQKYNISDIQRFYYLKEKHSAFSFFGFQSEYELFQFITDQSIKSLATNEIIYFYSDIIKKNHDKKQNHDCKRKKNEEDLFHEFKPKNKTFYIYFVERKRPDPKKMKYRHRSIHQISRAFDVQRYCYYPNEKNIYSFFGFSTLRQLRCNIENPDLPSLSLTNKIYFYIDNIRIDRRSKYLDDLLKILFLNKVTTYRDDRIDYSINTEKSDELPINDLNYIEFSPKENLFYVYFQELQKTDSKNFIQISNLSKYLNYKNDVQRYCFYPGSHDICSFIGFKNKKNAENMINDQSLQSELGKRQFYIYFKSMSNSNEGLSQINKDIIKEFKPQEDLIYIYMKEKEGRIKLQNVNDIQRFCYYPGTKEICSFYGYSNKKDLMDSIWFSKLKINDILNIKIYFENIKIDETFYTNMITVTEKCQEKIILENQLDLNENSFKQHPIRINTTTIKVDKNEIDDSKQDKIRNDLPKFNNYENNDLTFKTFIQYKNLFYCFFAEKITPNNRYINETNKKIYQINSATDVQRFCYYPKTKNIYTFIGFSNEDLLYAAMKKSSLKSAVIDQGIYIYPYKPSKIFQTKNQHNTVNYNEEQEIQSNSNKNMDLDYELGEKIQIEEKNLFENDSQLLDNKPKIIEPEPKISNIQANQEVEFFSPDEDLYYIYFIEKNNSLRNIHLQKVDLFGIKNIEDMQRGYKFTPKDPNFYTFFGFTQSLDCILTINKLSKNDEILNSSIKRIDDKDYSSEEEDEKIIRNDVRDANSNKSTIDEIESPKQNTNTFDDNENLINQHLETNEVNTRFHYKPPSVDTNQNSNKLYEKLKDSNNEKPLNGSIQSPNFNNNENRKSNGLSFREFIPNNKYKYLFFCEITEPNYRLLNRNYKKLFGIQFASDIQRFCYYPKTEKIFTFIGFSDQNQLIRAYKTTSLKISAVNRFIYFYPYEKIANDNNNESLFSNSFNQQNESNSTVEDNEETLEIFHPDSGLYYIYFKEKNCSVFNHINNNCSFYEIQNIQNLQRGFRINENDLNCYTFIGFSNSIDANSAMNKLSKNKLIDASSIHKFDDDDNNEYSSNSSDYEDISASDFEDESEDIINVLFYSKETLPEETIHFTS